MKNEITYRVNNEDYTLISDYKDDTHYRNSLNRLAKKTYGFDFEQWYLEGYWSDRYRPYSLVHNGEIVANVSVNPIDFMAEGNLHHTVQIGTVMTEEEYRHRGLSRILMEYVMEEFENTCECIYLYANDSVLEFYPKFGFTEAEEYNYSMLVHEQNNKLTTRRINIQEEKDNALLNRLVRNTVPVSGYSMIGNPGLYMFYLISFLSNDIYYIEELDLAAVASYEDDSLFLTEVFCEHEFDLQLVINSLVNDTVAKVTLGFTPLDKSSFQAEIFKEEGSTFFVKGKNPIDKGRFPGLSHA